MEQNTLEDIKCRMAASRIVSLRSYSARTDGFSSNSCLNRQQISTRRPAKEGDAPIAFSMSLEAQHEPSLNGPRLWIFDEKGILYYYYIIHDVFVYPTFEH